MTLSSAACFKCVHDTFLSTWVTETGALDHCNLCGDMAQSVALVEITARARAVLDQYIWEARNHRHWGSDGSRLESPGEPLKYWVAEVFACSPGAPIVQAVCGGLSEECEALPIFSTTIHYSIRPAGVKSALNRWCDIQEGMRHSSRFFNDEARQLLSWLFDDLGQYAESAEADHVVQTLKPDDCPAIYRARRSPAEKVERIRDNPDTELGSPPKEVSGEGRMNPAGIPAFYGAFDRQTCIAELRPLPQDSFISGRFQLIRAVRVLDFERFEGANLGPIPSFFDPEYFKHLDRQGFLHKIHEEIRIPVDEEEKRNYLITQAVAEYLALKCSPRFDGVIFRSAQRAEGRNIVLFSHAAAKPTSSTVRFATGYRVSGAKAGDPLSIEYVAGSMILHTIDKDNVGTMDEVLKETESSNAIPEA
ncbi:RES family NAD+ phosphorylase [Pseudomonas amygdali]|nr:hypothetical protein A988_19396 [Pseudomonas syringae BRIP39023]KEZ26356.1 hypothetical protein A3SK_0116110 [Pseudomonas amygdali pv. tabaci str. 6605]POR58632.1 hypothetical protein BKM23_16440 [Pseudomonas syringae pv. syringae]QNR42411.1 hypothetical protein D5S12_14100 [Pseudomonas syringae]UBT79570.1 RES family NAD+ phosphorylase [Pseudomonas amygdali]